MTILDEITDRIRADLVATKRDMPVEELRAQASSHGAARDFAAALRARSAQPPRIIAELKRASPSRGLIRNDFDPAALAAELEAHGAAALSVLTEVHYFQGSPAFLRMTTATVAIPVLRKDFIVDVYQLHEARAWGADAVLLIAAALRPIDFQRLHAAAHEIGLAVLAEVHNRDELQTVLDARAEVIGINSRDLRTFKTDLNTTVELLQAIPEDTITVAESGIHGPKDIMRLTVAGADAFLIGESLMRAPAPGDMLDTLLQAPPCVDTDG